MSVRDTIWWRVALSFLTLVTALCLWNAGRYAYSLALGRPLRVWGLADGAVGLLVLGDGGRSQATIAPGSTGWWLGAAGALLVLGLIAGAAWLDRAHVAEDAEKGVYGVVFGVAVSAALGDCIGAVLPLLVGAWQVVWCLLALFTGTGLRMVGDAGARGCPFVQGFGDRVHPAVRPGEGVWWMALVFGLVLLAISVLRLGLRERTPPTRRPRPTARHC